MLTAESLPKLDQIRSCLSIWHFPLYPRQSVSSSQVLRTQDRVTCSQAPASSTEPACKKGESRRHVHELASPRWHRLEARSHFHWARCLQQRRMPPRQETGQRGRVEAEPGLHPQSSPARGDHDLGPGTHFRGHRHCRHSAPPCAHEERSRRTCSPEDCLELGSAASAAAPVNQRKCTEPPPLTAAPFRRRAAAPAAFRCLAECPPEPLPPRRRSPSMKGFLLVIPYKSSSVVCASCAHARAERASLEWPRSRRRCWESRR
jgi:hypothetical protein